jgi:hypothetical protein
MVGDSYDRLRVTPPTELAEAVEAQIREAREVLRADAADAGLDPQLVDAALNSVVAAYADARVHAFIGILIEREVRSALHLETHGLPRDGLGSGTRRDG